MALRFGTDGIRGVANRELTPELVTALGRATVRVLGSDRPLVVGRDTELVVTNCSPDIEAVALVDGHQIGSLPPGAHARMRLGIARALVGLDDELRPSLKKAGLLTRDAREKERRKYGLKKARKAPQYSKR